MWGVWVCGGGTHLTVEARKVDVIFVMWISCKLRELSKEVTCFCVLILLCGEIKEVSSTLIG